MPKRTVKSCGPDASAVGVKSAEGKSARPGADQPVFRRRRRQQSPILRGERAISRKAIAQGIFCGKIINKINGKSGLYPPVCRDPLRPKIFNNLSAGSRSMRATVARCLVPSCQNIAQAGLGSKRNSKSTPVRLTFAADHALWMRKTNLARLLARRPDDIFVAPFEAGEIGPDLFRATCEMGLVSKRRDRPYQTGRSKHWIQVTNRTSGDNTGDGGVPADRSTIAGAAFEKGHCRWTVLPQFLRAICNSQDSSWS